MPPNPFNNIPGGQPMTGQPGAQPAFTGPLNVQTGSPEMDTLLRAGGPYILQQLFGQGKLPTQFMPQQSVYDQMLAKRYQDNLTQSGNMAAQRDTGFMMDIMGGAKQLFTGKELTDVDRNQNMLAAKTLNQMMPFISQSLGPDIMDQLHGSKGSAKVFNDRAFNALQTAIDPISGRVGFSAQSAGMFSESIFEELHGKNANPALMRGMSAGQSGALIEQLQSRGMLGPIADRQERLRGAADLDDATIQRIAERLPEIQQLRDQNKEVSPAAMETAKAKVRQTQAKMGGGAATPSPAELEKLVGGEDLLRASDAKRVSGRLKDMSEAVVAMQDIFGGMGKRGTMGELMTALDQLTQGNTATMAPKQVAQLVRNTQTIGRQTGRGIEGMLALSAHGHGLADRFNIDPIFATRLGHSAALFGAGAQDTSPARRRFGTLDNDKLTLMDQQLRASAAASPTVNQWNAMLRMEADESIAPGADTEAAAMLQAIKAGDTTDYMFQGQRRSLLQTEQQFTDILARDTGMRPDQIRTYVDARRANQELGNQFNTQDLGRKAQSTEYVRDFQQGFEATIYQRGDTAVMQRMQELGVVKDDAAYRKLSGDLAAPLGAALMNLAPDMVLNPANRAKLNETLLTEHTKNIEANLKAAHPDWSKDRIESTRDEMVRLTGGKAFGGTALSKIDVQSEGQPIDTFLKKFQLGNPRAHAAADERGVQAEAESAIRDSLSGLHQAEPLARLMDALAKAKPDTKPMDMLGHLLNMADPAQLAEKLPLTEYIKESQAEITGAYTKPWQQLTPEARDTITHHQRLIESYVAGTDTAATYSKQLEDAGKLTDPLRKKLGLAQTEGLRSILAHRVPLALPPGGPPPKVGPAGAAAAALGNIPGAPLITNALSDVMKPLTAGLSAALPMDAIAKPLGDMLGGLASPLEALKNPLSGLLDGSSISGLLGNTLGMNAVQQPPGGKTAAAAPPININMQNMKITGSLDLHENGRADLLASVDGNPYSVPVVAKS